MNRDFVDLLRALSDAEARFLVVGAFAFGRYARPRATGDLDLWIDRSPEDAATVLRALRAFGRRSESSRRPISNARTSSSRWASCPGAWICSPR
jgi:hypothetical protein